MNETEEMICHHTQNEGIGSVYERIMIQRLLGRLMRDEGIKSILEYNCDITKGYDNVIFLRNGCQVTLKDPNIQNIEKEWKFNDKPRFQDFGNDGKYDLVWDFATIQRNPQVLDQMIRDSEKYLLIFVPNFLNWGTPFHIAYHLLTRTDCHHAERGIRSLRTRSGLHKLIRKKGIEIIESGYIDMPPLPDIGFSIRELKGVLGWKVKSKSADTLPSQRVYNKIEQMSFLEKAKLPSFIKAPLAHHIYVLGKASDKERDLMVEFLERNLPAMPENFDEGLGIASERYAVNLILESICATSPIKSVLEAPVDGLMGIPGMNSVTFARNGANVTIASPSNKILGRARIFWDRLGLSEKVAFMNAYDHFPFADNSFDLVWNYCMFEHFNDVDKLLEEMKRVSRKYILLVTQNSYNYGYPIHRLYHWSNRQRWDHGSSQMMKLGNLKRLFREHGLKISINGCVDVPPFFDTFDMHTRGKIKFFMKGQSKEKWFWSSLQKEDMERLSQDKTIARLQSFERSLKGPFRYLFAHHFFLLGVKDEK